MNHLSEDGTDHGPMFGIKKGSTKFRFGGRRWYHPHDGVEDTSGAVHER